MVISMRSANLITSLSPCKLGESKDVEKYEYVQSALEV